MATEKQSESAAVFNPWTATFDDAIAANEASTLSIGDPTRPLYQWNGAQRLEAMRAGALINGFDVLACVRICANHDLVMPEWLAFAFIRRYDAVLNCRAGSWDDPAAFGKPYPKGTHLSALRKARVNSYAVWNMVNSILKANPERAIDKGLFEEVGEHLGLGATLADEYYYQVKRRWPNPAKKGKIAGLHKPK